MISNKNDNNDNPLRLLIVDDQPVILRGLSMILGAEPGIEIVGQAADGLEAIEMAENLIPDVIVMDIQMPRASGVVATREINIKNPAIGIIILTTFDTDDLVFEAIRAGAQAYLLKDATEKEVLETVRAVHRGESRLSPVIAQKVMTQFRAMAEIQTLPNPPPINDSNTLPPDRPDLEAKNHSPLTEKEQRILALIADGKTNKQIAATVFLAEGTIKNYVSRIMEKLHASSRTELAIRALGRQN